MEAKTGFTASRRSFLRQGGALAAAAALLGPAQILAAERSVSLPALTNLGKMASSSSFSW
jgi:hypothetical protein